MNNTSLFKSGEFVAHSGDVLDFKIECDALSDDSIETIAKFIADRTAFGLVQGIPRGGCRLADALEEYADWQAPFNILIIDDVLTTGSSMEKAKANQPPIVDPDDVIGWVIFSRIEPPSWINAVFQLNHDI